MDHTAKERYEISRRETLKRLGSGFGGLALAAILNKDALAARRIHDLQPRQPVHPPKAKAVI